MAAIPPGVRELAGACQTARRNGLSAQTQGRARMDEAYIGVDVGTGSARAGVFDVAGRLLASAKRPIEIWYEPGEIVEQSSEDIWRAATGAVREAVAASGLPQQAFAGI